MRGAVESACAVEGALSTANSSVPAHRCCGDILHRGRAQTPRSWCLAAAQSKDGQSGIQETFLPSLHLQPDLGHGSSSAEHSSSGSGDPG